MSWAYGILKAMAAISGAWAVLFLVTVGIGSAAVRLLGDRPEDGVSYVRSFWPGWFLTIVFLQLWHLWLPIDWRALAVVCAAGGAGLLWGGRGLFRAVARGKWWAYALAVLLVLRLADNAAGPIDHGDAGYYHVTAVKWASSYPIVPGLGNLHHPLAINCAHFLYVAMLDTGWWEGRAPHLANGLILGVALLQCVLLAVRGLRGHDNRASGAFYALGVPALLSQTLARRTQYNIMFLHYVSNPTPDLPVFVLGLLAAGALVELAESDEAASGRTSPLVCEVAALSLLGVMVKLSMVVLGAGLTASAFAFWLWRSRRAGLAVRRALVVVVGAAVVSMALWAVRSVILSGYVAYPSTLLSVGVDWRVPPDVVRYEAGYIADFARWSPTPALRDWMGRWVPHVYRNAFWIVVVPLALMVAAVLTSIGARVAGRWRPGPLGRRLALMVVAPALASMAFWFVTAPAARFAGATFWILAGAAAASAVGQSGARGGKALGRAVALLALCLAVLQVNRMEVFGSGLDGGFHPMPWVATDVYRTESGLEVRVPVIDKLGWTQNVWDAELPAAWEPYPDLRLRREGDMRSGFALDPARPHENKYAKAKVFPIPSGR
jgi:hypothetical protein